MLRSRIARTKLSFADSPRPRMFSAGEQHDDDQPAEDVVGVVRERMQARERAQVVGHEERGDRDREDVVEAQRPAGEERDDVVEGVARKRGGAAGFGEHRGALGVRFGGQREQAAGEQEHQRRQPERVGGDEPERVVDRGADVAVGGREQPRRRRPIGAVRARSGVPLAAAYTVAGRMGGSACGPAPGPRMHGPAIGACADGRIAHATVARRRRMRRQNCKIPFMAWPEQERAI